MTYKQESPFISILDLISSNRASSRQIAVAIDLHEIWRHTIKDDVIVNDDEEFRAIDEALEWYRRTQKPTRDKSLFSVVVDVVNSQEATLERYGWPQDKLPDFNNLELPSP